MKLKTKHKQLNNRFFTIIIVPRASSKTRTIRIPKWIFIPVLVLIAATFYTMGRMHDNINLLNKELADKNASISEYAELLDLSASNIDELEGDIESYKKKLISLLAVTEDLDRRTEEATEINKKIIEEIGDLIGLKIEVEEEDKLSSRGGPRPDINSLLPQNATFNQGYATLTARLLETESSLKSLETSTTKLSERFEEMKNYLKAYPSILPVKGEFTSHFGYRKNPITGKGKEFHSGLDIRAERGTNVKATGAGTVTFSGYSSGYGYLVIIDHGYGFETYYAHNSKLLVKRGQKVQRGDVIAKSGNSGRSTGPHVHYEVRVRGVAKNPLDYILN